MAIQADAVFPITLDILGKDGHIRPHAYTDPRLQNFRREFYFTTLLTSWLNPRTGEATFPLAYFPCCSKLKGIFRGMRLSQPVAPGIIYLVQTEFCDACVPRPETHLILDATGQTIRFGSFFDHTEWPVQVRAQLSKAVTPIECLEFRINDKALLLAGKSCRICASSQPYDARSASRQGATL